LFLLYIVPKTTAVSETCIALQTVSLKLGGQQSVFSSMTQWVSFSIWSIFRRLEEFGAIVHRYGKRRWTRASMVFMDEARTQPEFADNAIDRHHRPCGCRL
jgi:hypothetical protein